MSYSWISKENKKSMYGRGERTRQPQADLNLPEAGKCAEGAQASLEDCFTRLRRAPTSIPAHQAIYVLDRTSEIFPFSLLTCNRKNFPYEEQ